MHLLPKPQTQLNKSDYSKSVNTAPNSNTKTTELSKHIWELKSPNISYDLDWKIITIPPLYTTSRGACHLCLTEKYYVIYRPEMCSLNKHNELALHAGTSTNSF